MNTNLFRIGFVSGILAFGFTLAFVISQICQILEYLSYPYDEILIYGFSLCIVIPLLLEILALHYVTPLDNRYWSHASLIFIIFYAVFVTANYTVQLATVIPLTLRGDKLQTMHLAQTPHSLLWNFDALGYISMGIASLFIYFLFNKIGFNYWVKTAFLANAAVTPLVAFVYFYPDFSETILLIALPWAITAPLAMLTLAIWFKVNKLK